MATWCLSSSRCLEDIPDAGLRDGPSDRWASDVDLHGMSEAGIAGSAPQEDDHSEKQVVAYARPAVDTDGQSGEIL